MKLGHSRQESNTVVLKSWSSIWIIIYILIRYFYMLYLFYYITLFMNKFYDANIWMFVIYSYLLIWKIYIDKNAWILKMKNLKFKS